jgi:ribonuclease HI
MTEELLKVWTDGACSNNQNPKLASAGVGVFFDFGSPLNISEPLQGPIQTNQRAELTAVIRALQTVECDVLIITDSTYAMKGAIEWMKNWKRNGWVNSKKKAVSNKDLWMQLDGLLSSKKRKVKFKWVKGHDKDKGNQEADKLAVNGIRDNKK